MCRKEIYPVIHQNIMVWLTIPSLVEELLARLKNLKKSVTNHAKTKDFKDYRSVLKIFDFDLESRVGFVLVMAGVKPGCEVFLPPDMLFTDFLQFLRKNGHFSLENFGTALFSKESFNYMDSDEWLGEFFGYPKCCVKGFMKSFGDDIIIELARKPDRAKKMLFVFHMPCSAECGETARLNRTFERILKDYDTKLWEEYSDDSIKSCKRLINRLIGMNRGNKTNLNRLKARINGLKEA